MWIDGSDVRSSGGDCEPPGDSWLLIVHAGGREAQVTLPGQEYGARYHPVLDTGTPDGVPEAVAAHPPGASIVVPARTALLFRVQR
jgi:isoamylase